MMTWLMIGVIALGVIAAVAVTACDPSRDDNLTGERGETGNAP